MTVLVTGHLAADGGTSGVTSHGDVTEATPVDVTGSTSYHASRVTKVPVQLRRFRLLTPSNPLPADLRAPKLPVPTIESVVYRAA